jgi:hypothetical protein
MLPLQLQLLFRFLWATFLVRYTTYIIIMVAFGICVCQCDVLSGHPIRGPASLCAGALGLTAGFIAAYQNSSARLLGYAENAKEVAAEQKTHQKARAASVAQNPANN